MLKFVVVALVAMAVLLAAGSMWGGGDAAAAGHMHHTHSVGGQSHHHGHHHASSVGDPGEPAFDMSLVEVADASDGGGDQADAEHGPHALHSHVALFLDRVEEFLPQLHVTRISLAFPAEAGASLTAGRPDKPPRA
ncbi:hypothetical protein ACFONL_01605 [Camelimonas fluminis]|uniref:Uncharacterized protein n=1 Tax=Camelimonas fluminis TaxID=1576911 RepID=A0ABV7UBR4_9HYPH|nr:hypothetical protein [Camelimonas fluminis]